MLSINFILSANYEKKKRPITSPVAEHLRPRDFSNNWGMNINTNAVKNRLNESLTLNFIPLRFKKLLKRNTLTFFCQTRDYLVLFFNLLFCSYILFLTFSKWEMSSFLVIDI